MALMRIQHRVRIDPHLKRARKTGMHAVIANSDRQVFVEQEQSRKRQTISFFDLPPEIRNQIYGLLLTTTARPESHHGVRLCPALLRTCKLINAEATAVLYKGNIFTAHSTLLTSLPHLLNPAQPVLSTHAAARITRWRINVRLDIDQRYTIDEVTKAFTGAEELEIEPHEAMYRSSGCGVLMLFKDVRGVTKAKVWGSVNETLARWLEGVMMSEVGSPLTLAAELTGEDVETKARTKEEVWSLRNR